MEHNSAHGPTSSSSVVGVQSTASITPLQQSVASTLLSVVIFFGQVAASALIVSAIAMPSWLVVGWSSDVPSTLPTAPPVMLSAFSLCYGTQCENLPGPWSGGLTCSAGGTVAGDTLVQHIRGTQGCIVMTFLLLVPSTVIAGLFLFRFSTLKAALRELDRVYRQLVSSSLSGSPLAARGMALSSGATEPIGSLDLEPQTGAEEDVEVVVSHLMPPVDVQRVAAEIASAALRALEEQRRVHPKGNVPSAAELVAESHAALQIVEHRSGQRPLAAIQHCRRLQTIGAAMSTVTLLFAALGAGLFQRLVDSQLNCGHSYCDALATSGPGCGFGGGFRMAVAVAVLCGLAVAEWLCVFAAVRIPLRLSESFLQSFVLCLRKAAAEAQRGVEERVGVTAAPSSHQQQDGDATRTTTHLDPLPPPQHRPPLRPHPPALRTELTTPLPPSNSNGNVVVRTIHHAADRKQLSSDAAAPHVAPDRVAHPFTTRLPSVRSVKSHGSVGVVSEGGMAAEHRGNSDAADQHRPLVPRNSTGGGGGPKSEGGTLPRVAHHGLASGSGAHGGSDSSTVPAASRGPAPRDDTDSWVYDASQGLYWSAARQWFYDPLSLEFYDPTTNQWFNERRGGWYTLPPSETRRRQERSRSTSPHNPLPAAVAPQSVAMPPKPHR